MSHHRRWWFSAWLEPSARPDLDELREMLAEHRAEIEPSRLSKLGLPYYGLGDELDPMRELATGQAERLRRRKRTKLARYAKYAKVELAGGRRETPGQQRQREQREAAREERARARKETQTAAAAEEKRRRAELRAELDERRRVMVEEARREVEARRREWDSIVARQRARIERVVRYEREIRPLIKGARKLLDEVRARERRFLGRCRAVQLKLYPREGDDE